MITIHSLLADLQAIQASHVAESAHVLGQGRQVVKVRIQISGDLFVQAYRNDRFSTTNLAVILGDTRIYGRDEREGLWHRHPVSDPESHDHSEEARREVTLGEFWREALAVVSDLGLLF